MFNFRFIKIFIFMMFISVLCKADIPEKVTIFSLKEIKSKLVADEKAFYELHYKNLNNDLTYGDTSSGPYLNNDTGFDCLLVFTKEFVFNKEKYDKSCVLKSGEVLNIFPYVFGFIPSQVKHISVYKICGKKEKFIGNFKYIQD